VKQSAATVAPVVARSARPGVGRCPASRRMAATGR
jgi:hypothetical protein